MDIEVTPHWWLTFYNKLLLSNCFILCFQGYHLGWFLLFVETVNTIIFGAASVQKVSYLRLCGYCCCFNWKKVAYSAHERCSLQFDQTDWTISTYTEIKSFFNATGCETHFTHYVFEHITEYYSALLHMPFPDNKDVFIVAREPIAIRLTGLA